MTAPGPSPTASWLTMLGSLALLGSLFLTWSHQIPPAEHRRFHGGVLFGVPASPTAWQVYAIAALVLAAVALGIAAAGLWGQRPTRAAAALAAALALAFVLHAAAHAPTNGLLLSTGSGARTRYFSDPATAGPGETVAIVGLALALLGLVLGLVWPERQRAEAGPVPA